METEPVEPNGNGTEPQEEVEETQEEVEETQEEQENNATRTRPTQLKVIQS